MKVFLFVLFAGLVIIGCKSKMSANASYDNVNVEGAKSMIADNPELVVLDVRTPGETAQGMLPNAIEIDYKASNFKEKVAALDKSKSYLVYCKSGGRSARASSVMKELGFEKVTNMEGGYSGWK